MGNKVALVTGGARGIGFGIALRLAQDGFDLAIAGRRAAEDVQDAVDRIRERGTDALYVQADVADGCARARLLLAVEERFGRLDVLVNNAGIAPRVRADILEAGEEHFDEVMATNLKGPYFLTQAVAAWMIRQRESLGAAASRRYQYWFDLGYGGQRESRRVLPVESGSRYGDAAVGGAAGGVWHRRVRGAAGNYRERDDRRRARQIRCAD